MDVRRTAVVKLIASDEHRDALHRTSDQYLYCANRTSEYCWSNTSYTKCKTNKREVRDALYAELRAETELPAQLVQAAIRHENSLTCPCGFEGHADLVASESFLRRQNTAVGAMARPVYLKWNKHSWREHHSPPSIGVETTANEECTNQSTTAGENIALGKAQND
jgi:hypothetical protein